VVSSSDCYVRAVLSPYGKLALSTDTAPGRRLLAWYERRRSGRTTAVVWLVTRLLTLLVLATAESFVVGDVFYYWRKLAALPGVGLASTLNEYPTPVVWLLWLPYGVTGGSRVGYLVAFLVFMLALDAALQWALWRAHRRHPTDTGARAVDFWLLFVPLIGPLSYLRFDLVPAVLAGAALLAARKRPWVTGALTGLGAAIKLWPALLIPAFLAHKPDRRAASTGFLVAGVGLAVISLIAGGWSRLLSPLTWQSGRGLQIESIWSTPLMLARAVRPARWVVDLSRFQAYEIFGPGVPVLLLLSNLATVLGLVVIGLLFVRAYRAAHPTAVALGLVVLATVAVMTVTNKTLSPQYLLWLGGPTAALLLLVGDSAAPLRSTIRRVALHLLGLALLTHLVYPLLYDGLLGRRGEAVLVVATLVTALRNLALVLFTIEVSVLAWRFLAPVAAEASAETSEGGTTTADVPES
jgi:branched-subunit amino acid transport protein AzlD